MKLLNPKNVDEQRLFEQYKLYLDGATEISNRRQKANEYFLTINTILVSLIVFVSQYKQINDPRLIICFIAIIGLINSVITYFLIRSYKQINTVKFQVLHELEASMPANLYAYEWEKLGKGKDRKKYWPFSHLELKIPLLFSAIFIVLALLYYFKG
jgi:hypothetical protein